MRPGSIREAISLVVGGLFVAFSAGASEESPDYPIQPVPFHQVQVAGGFWAPRLKTNREVTVPYDFRKCEETGRIENFVTAGSRQPGKFRGIFFNDSDVFKVIEGAAYCLAESPDPRLDGYLDDLIAKIAKAQEPDGYLYTARTIQDPNYDFPGRAARWSQLSASHELYNIGHLYEAAVAHFQATGKRSLLDVAIKSADLVCRDFGRNPGQRLDVPGHEEIELGLVKLYRATGQEKYLKQAEFFIDLRGQKDLRPIYGEYCQDHLPVVKQDRAVGHAVRAGYLYAGVADVAALTGRQDYIAAIDRLWRDIVGSKMYLTGGVGATAHGEKFGASYELPNESAYNETCAAIAQALFNHRMFLLHGDSQYVDVLERILYNGVLPGVSLSGDQFFYPNPLACNGRSRFNQGVLGRSPWFDCSCCPVNVVRFLPSIAGFVYAHRGNDLYVNLFVEGTGTVQLGERKVMLTQETDYPWSGKIRLTIQVAEPVEFTIRVRIPGWCQGRPVPSDLYYYEPADAAQYRLHVQSGSDRSTIDSSVLRQGYAVVRRTWRSGDVLELDVPMPVRRVNAHEQVVAARQRVALERGPLVYCLEAVDHGGSVADLWLPSTSPLQAEIRPDLLGGMTVLTGEARRVVRDAAGELSEQPTRLTAVPYYAWAHRGVGEMAVWLAREPSAAHVSPAPTVASRSHASASHVWAADTVDALNDQLEPKSSIDHDIPRHTWWDHRGTREWLQYDFAKPMSVRAVAVYWFDDTGRGQCRVPLSCRILYRDGDEWRPVSSAQDLGMGKDQFNRATFTPVRTTAIRLDVQLQNGFSGGVLEWQVE